MHRLGRWIDFENDYKTLDPTFMESVWWAFSELYKKGLVYRGFKAGIAWHRACQWLYSCMRMCFMCTGCALCMRCMLRSCAWVPVACCMLHAGHALLHGMQHHAVQLRGWPKLQRRR